MYKFCRSETRLTLKISSLKEVPGEIYKVIRENNNKICVGYQRCKVYDHIGITTCYNCGRIGHNSKKCKNDQVCTKCTGNHSSKECKSKTFKCINCTYSNNKYKTDYDINHSPSDSNNCQILKNKINKYIGATDYPIMPTLPTWKPRIIVTTKSADGRITRSVRRGNPATSAET